jgi:hypothetical protein
MNMQIACTRSTARAAFAFIGLVGRLRRLPLPRAWASLKQLPQDARSVC